MNYKLKDARIIFGRGNSSEVNTTSTVEYEVYDLLGRKMITNNTNTCTGQSILNTESLDNDIYCVVARSKNGTPASKFYCKMKDYSSSPCMMSVRNCSTERTRLLTPTKSTKPIHAAPKTPPM